MGIYIRAIADDYPQERLHFMMPKIRCQKRQAIVMKPM